MDGVHVHDDLLEDYRRSAIDTHVSALSGFARRLDGIPSDATSHARTGRAPDCVGEYSRPAVRARSGAVVGAQPALLRRHARLEPGGAGDLQLRARDRARPPRALEAAPGAAARAGGARQHQGPAGDFRQGRHRYVARRDVVHRRRSAARLLGGRRSAPARRPGRRVHRSRAYDRRLRRRISRPTFARRPRARFRLGRERFEQKLRLEEGITLHGRSAARDRDARARRRRRRNFASSPAV